MALKALVDGEEVRSWQLSDEEWKALVASTKSGEICVTMCCCGSRAIPKKGSRKPHFAHYRRPADCVHKDKSPEHEEAKYIIALACEEAGYEVDTEVAGPGYKADVLAIKDEERVAFEVQLTYQTFEVICERMQKFKADGVKDVWLLSRLPAGKKKNTPRMHPLTIDGHVFTVRHKGREKPLERFVKHFLQARETGKKSEPLRGIPLVDDIDIRWSIWPEIARMGCIIAVLLGLVTWLSGLGKPKRYRRYHR